MAASTSNVRYAYDEVTEIAIITLHMMVNVHDNRQITLTLPPEVPTGETEIVVSVAAAPAQTHAKKPRTSLSQWAESTSENWGDRIRSEDVESFTGRRY